MKRLKHYFTIYTARGLIRKTKRMQKKGGGGVNDLNLLLQPARMADNRVVGGTGRQTDI